MTGKELILEVEGIQLKLLTKLVDKNPFWKSILNNPKDVDENVYYGMCVENYHLLFRESYFDAPILSYPFSQKARLLINEFYIEELGHDKLLLKSLISVGLSESDLFESTPLPGTMALCNSLAYWSRHDPLFFFTTLGPLEGREIEIDSFVIAMHEKELSKEFIDPIESHANINMNAGHGLLTRDIFETIQVISDEDAKRIFTYTELFVKIYDRFYKNIWNHYSNGGKLIRKAVHYGKA
ncbi:hypothetical protein [Pedobacter sp. V48]|uniref:hypothetical protein n=1 Tax=Pedobacter sp. V48 TaxID=509635 RepID=UPI0003E4B9FC|nr:hypothetical protein [Pedobacter sp. V48]ETZ22831.1 hypothetical protein N824_21315 [Pedobacter sp. V48]